METLEKNYCLLSNDVETHSIWFNKLRDATGIRVYREAMPKLLDLYDDLGIKATFFFTGDIAKLVPDVVRITEHRGHEIGCHGYSHEMHHAFDSMPAEKQYRHLKKGKDILEDLAGQSVISFRAPALRVNHDTPEALARSGFRIDSSIAPQRWDCFLSFGSRNKFERLLSPRRPYLTDSSNLARRGDGPIIEVPLSSLLVPYVGSTKRVFPRASKWLQAALIYESKKRRVPISTYSHPNEFIDERDEASQGFNRRSAGLVEYLLADLIRYKIKIKNLGPVGFGLYEQHVKRFSEQGFTFSTIRSYCEEAGFLEGDI